LSQTIGANIPPVLVGFAALVVSVVVAWVALKIYDEPVRQRLASKLRGETRVELPAASGNDVRKRLPKRRADAA
jgi:peptidoglycan/LPS O-acetylase OafA/YrhL